MKLKREEKGTKGKGNKGVAPKSSNSLIQRQMMKE